MMQLGLKERITANPSEEVKVTRNNLAKKMTRDKTSTTNDRTTLREP
jgi:hypothetical protein